MLAPGAKASATIAAFSRADRLRRLLLVIRSRCRSLARACLSVGLAFRMTTSRTPLVSTEGYAVGNLGRNVGQPCRYP